MFGANMHESIELGINAQRVSRENGGMAGGTEGADQNVAKHTGHNVRHLDARNGQRGVHKVGSRHRCLQSCFLYSNFSHLFMHIFFQPLSTLILNILDPIVKKHKAVLINSLGTVWRFRCADSEHKVREDNQNEHIFY
jgi:hypothetical protein